MEKELYYYYGLSTKELMEDHGDYIFYVDGIKYVLRNVVRSKEELEDLYVVNEELRKKGLSSSVFLLNKQNTFISVILEKRYLLTREERSNEEEFTTNDMLAFWKKIPLNENKSVLYRNNWSNLWASKMDYFEYQVGELGLKKPFIVNSFSYFLGIAENAISYVGSVEKNYKISSLDKIVLSHRRLPSPCMTKDFLNPLSYIFDLEVRDVSGYVKSTFWKYGIRDALIELKTFLNLEPLTLYSASLLFARLLYPSFYFDQYEKVMEGLEEENTLLHFTEKTWEYEQFLREAYLLISFKYPIEPVNWILKKES